MVLKDAKLMFFIIGVYTVLALYGKRRWFQRNCGNTVFTRAIIDSVADYPGAVPTVEAAMAMQITPLNLLT